MCYIYSYQQITRTKINNRQIRQTASKNALRHMSLRRELQRYNHNKNDCPHVGKISRSEVALHFIHDNRECLSTGNYRPKQWKSKKAMPSGNRGCSNTNRRAHQTTFRSKYTVLKYHTLCILLRFVLAIK